MVKVHLESHTLFDVSEPYKSTCVAHSMHHFHSHERDSDESNLKNFKHIPQDNFYTTTLTKNTAQDMATQVLLPIETTTSTPTNIPNDVSTDDTANAHLSSYTTFPQQVRKRTSSNIDNMPQEKTVAEREASTPRLRKIRKVVLKIKPQLRLVNRPYEYYQIVSDDSTDYVTDDERLHILKALEKAANEKGVDKELINVEDIYGRVELKKPQIGFTPPNHPSIYHAYDATIDTTRSSIQLEGLCPGCGTDEPWCVTLCHQMMPDLICKDCKGIFSLGIPTHGVSTPKQDEPYLFKGSEFKDQAIAAAKYKQPEELGDILKPTETRPKVFLKVSYESPHTGYLKRLDPIEVSSDNISLADTLTLMLHKIKEELFI